MDGPDLGAVRRRIANGDRGAPFDPRPIAFTAGSDLRKMDIDGTSIIVKHLHPEGDWLSRATGGVGRAQLLWRSGVLDQIEPFVEHGVIGVLDLEDHDAIVMRDLSPVLFPPTGALDRDAVEGVLARLGRFHREAAVIDLPPLCSMRQRAAFMDPRFHAADTGHGNLATTAHLIPDTVRFLSGKAGAAGHELLHLFEDPDAFVRRVIESAPDLTLLHGDPKPDNIGYTGSRLVAIDWGELTGVGPIEFDVVRFVVGACLTHTSLEPQEVYEIYDRSGPRPLDPATLYLAMLWAVANFGITNFAVIRALCDPGHRALAKAAGRLWLNELQRLHAER